MALLSEREIIEAAEQNAKDTLRKNGLSHLSVKVISVKGNQAHLDIDGGTPDEIKRAFALFGVKYEGDASDISRTGRIDAGL